MAKKTGKGLFENKPTTSAPLAERMRPRSLDEYFGQDKLTGPDGFLTAVANTRKAPSIIIWGPPGSGKTTFARLIATITDDYFASFSAVLSGVGEVREVIAEAKKRRDMTGVGTVLFVDEVHRFNKAQQDAFLPHVEDGTITLIGATTENPSFEVIAPLLSRCRVVTLERLSDEHIGKIIDRAIADTERGLGGMKIELDDEARELLIEAADGDARKALNSIEIAASFAGKGKTIAASDAVRAIQSKRPKHDKAGEDHYNVVSAFIKSMRGSDPDAAVYWMARMLEAGEDARFIARRMIIFASEDVGNAEPAGLMIATAAAAAVENVGLPEAAINLSHAATYLASAPKSNASYMALKEAKAEIARSGALDVPVHLRNAPTKLMKELGYGAAYEYPHDFEGGHVVQQYLPDKLKGKIFYRPTDHGREKAIADRLEALRKKTGKK